MDKDKKNKDDCKPSFKLCGTTNIGSKGQVVIPKEARDLIGISPWDSVSFVVKDKELIGIIPNKSIDTLMEYIISETNWEFIK